MQLFLIVIKLWGMRKPAYFGFQVPRECSSDGRMIFADLESQIYNFLNMQNSRFWENDPCGMNQMELLIK